MSPLMLSASQRIHANAYQPVRSRDPPRPPPSGRSSSASGRNISNCTYLPFVRPRLTNFAMRSLARRITVQVARSFLSRADGGRAEARLDPPAGTTRMREEDEKDVPRRRADGEAERRARAAGGMVKFLPFLKHQEKAVLASESSTHVYTKLQPLF